MVDESVARSLDESRPPPSRDVTTLCTAEAGDGAGSREALYELLRFWQQELETKNPDFLTIKANFIPGHSRAPKRKAPEGDD